MHLLVLSLVVNLDCEINYDFCITVFIRLVLNGLFVLSF